MLARVSAHSTYSHKNPHSHSVTVKMIAMMSSVLYDDAETVKSSNWTHRAASPCAHALRRIMEKDAFYQRKAVQEVAAPIFAERY